MNEELKIGDLVETCDMHPGFITSIDGDNVTVFVPTKLQDYCNIYGGNHSIRNCGIHKISSEYAMMLFSFTKDELTKLWEETEHKESWEDIVRKAYREKLNKKL